MSGLHTMFITNSPDKAREVVAAGVDRVFIDLEKIGKQERQGGLDTVKSDHTLDDVSLMRASLPSAEILVRVNPPGEHSAGEIDEAIARGADIIMLPMYKTSEEVETFLEQVGGRAKTNLLLETPQALVRLPQYLPLAHGIDEILVGLNDLHLGMGLDFMFEIVAGGLLDGVSRQIKEAGIRFGFGGIARIGAGAVPAEDVLVEHVRLGSELVIISRSFATPDGRHGPFDFAAELSKIRAHLEKLRELSEPELLVLSEGVREKIFAAAAALRRTR